MGANAPHHGPGKLDQTDTQCEERGNSAAAARQSHIEMDNEYTRDVYQPPARQSARRNDPVTLDIAVRGGVAQICANSGTNLGNLTATRRSKLREPLQTTVTELVSSPVTGYIQGICNVGNLQER